MAATFLNEITREQIRIRLNDAVHARVADWSNAEKPTDADAEAWDDQVCYRLYDVTVDDVYDVLKHCGIVGDSPRDEIDMAISMACELPGMPGCIIDVDFND